MLLLSCSLLRQLLIAIANATSTTTFTPFVLSACTTTITATTDVTPIGTTTTTSRSSVRVQMTVENFYRVVLATVNK